MKLLKKSWILIVAGIIGFLGAFALGRGVGATKPKAVASVASIPWSVSTVTSQAFSIQLPCRNTITKPKLDAYGFFNLTETGYTAAECNSDLGTYTVVDLPVTYPTDAAGQEQWLRKQFGDPTDPITRIHGAMAIIANQPAGLGVVKSAAIVANTHYYLVSTAGAAKTSGIQDQVIRSFTPLN